MTPTGLTRTIAEVATRLPANHVDIWATVLATAPHPSHALETALIDACPGYAVAGAAHQLVTAWRHHAPELPGDAVALALASASAVHQRTDDARTTLAVSGPSSPSVPVRLTSSVVTELVRHARHTLLVVSFAAYHVPDVVRELTHAADRGVTIDLVLEDSAEDGGTLRGPSGAAAAFTRLREQARFWHWPGRHRGTSNRSHAAMHAKVVAADATTALVSSANLTDRALSHNLEIGILLRESSVVARLVTHFTALMHDGPLEQAPPP